MTKCPQFLIAYCVAQLLATTASAQPKSLVIGIDGMGYGAFGFAFADTPNIDGLIDGTWQVEYQGAYSDQAFAGGVIGTPTEQETSSLPSWSTVLTGVWADKHKVPTNVLVNPDFDNNPTYLETLEENVTNLHSASVINWVPIDTNIIATVDDANSSMDLRSTPGNDANVNTTTAALLGAIDTDDPAAVFIVFDEVDSVGHGYGSDHPSPFVDSTVYSDEIEETDGLVGQLLSALVSRPNFANEDWQIIIISDHGQRPQGGHGGQTEVERTVPFVVASKNLNQGDLSSLPQEVSIADVAPTVLGHFGLTIPSRYYGISRASGAPLPSADFNGDNDVDGDDFLTWQLGFGTPMDASHDDGDADWDGDVDEDDLAIFQTSYGSPPPASLATVVPEPGTAVLTSVMVSFGISQRSRRRRVRVR